MKTVRLSLVENAAKTMVYIPSLLVGSRVDYCNSILHRVSVVLVQPLQNVLNVAVRIILRKRKFDRITADLCDQLHWLLVQR